MENKYFDYGAIANIDSPDCSGNTFAPVLDTLSLLELTQKIAAKSGKDVS